MARDLLCNLRLAIAMLAACARTEASTQDTHAATSSDPAPHLAEPLPSALDDPPKASQLPTSVASASISPGASAAASGANPTSGARPTTGGGELPVAGALPPSSKTPPPLPAPPPEAPRFLPENPRCAVPIGQPSWSWRRLHRVEGLAEPTAIFTLDVGARLPNLERVLDLLADRGVRTTIFLYTKEVERSPRGAAIVKRMLADGHELANHTLSHGDLTKSSADEVTEELEAVERFVQGAAGVTTRPFFREPFLARDDAVDAIVAGLCFRSIWFTVDTRDWEKGITAADIVRASIGDAAKPREIESGSIFIYHGSQKENLVALPIVIDEIRRRGMVIRPLGEALRLARPDEKAR